MATEAKGETKTETAAEVQFKQCPRCQVYTERIKGCNLMRCTACPTPRTKWCWVCGKVKQRKDKPKADQYCSEPQVPLPISIEI